MISIENTEGRVAGARIERQHDAGATVKPVARVLWFALLAVTGTIFVQPSLGQSVRELHQIFPMSVAEPVALRVDLASADLQIAYAREGQVSISIAAQIPAPMQVEEDFLTTQLIVEKTGNLLEIRQRYQGEELHTGVKVAYKIDVPYRTELYSFVDHGKQTITGIMGPVRAETTSGEIKVSYVSKNVVTRAGTGNLDLQVIGESVEARTGRGNISCIRAAQGVSAETGEGDISLMVIGPSQATVQHGIGRIFVGGARGSLIASTAAGDLNVKAVPHADWKLSSISGSIRVELPPGVDYQIDANTESGEVIVNRDDLDKVPVGARHFHKEPHVSGRSIEVRTEGGTIVIG